MVVAPRARLGATALRLQTCACTSTGSRVDAKLRYRSPGRTGQPSSARATGLDLRLDQPAFGVAPGQTAALYDGDAVVGVGTIVAPEDGMTAPDRPCVVAGLPG